MTIMLLLLPVIILSYLFMMLWVSNDASGNKLEPLILQVTFTICWAILLFGWIHLFIEYIGELG